VLLARFEYLSTDSRGVSAQIEGELCLWQAEPSGEG
jgi:hypothetical protein